ncbi:TPA: phage holin, lambda family [Pasteurella multocida]
MLNANTIQGVFSAIFVSVLRIGFMCKKISAFHKLLDATLCASLAYATISAGSHFFGHSEYSQFIGTMIGFIGTEKIREFLFKFINKKVDNSSIGGGYE